MAKRSTRSARKTARRIKRNVPRGCVYINTTFNNTIITVTDAQGDVIRWNSAGAAGFKGTRKSTPFAARVAAEKVAKDAIDNDGLQEVDVFVKGAGPGREASLRALAAVGLRVRSIVDTTPIPHNGCRPPKKRRV
ncbi:MAG TPA: 30S ribosomal protein S11 [Anaerolineae bacterium]|nr:30S ribosomal protein S11 [Anaerolineae bacterium]HQH37554.1 30S ribosomal protein S11 [Anaerolineae bacterium]